MGLDISIQTDKDEQIFSGDYHDPKYDYFNKHSLSQTFCNLMSRPDVVSGEPELDQIGRIVSVDVTPIYAMQNWGSDTGEELEFFLEIAESEEEKQQMLAQARQSKESLKGNLDQVLTTIDALIAKLSSVDDLPQRLNNHGYDTLDSKNYFADFNIDKGEGYIGNNFGQDLRNFKRFVEYAKDRGATTVYFNYG